MWLFVIFCVSLILYFSVFHDRKVWKEIEKVPGPNLIVSALGLLTCSPQEYLPLCMQLVEQYGKRLKIYIGLNLIYVLTDPEDVEVVLSNYEFHVKSREYDFLHPWIGLGLLTSSGEKWRKRRKVITPSFHFKILETFLGVFDSQTNTFIDRLKMRCDGESFDIYSYINLCALDIICESSMGCSINAQKNSDSDYVKAVHGICNLITARMNNVWKRYDILYKFSNDYKLQQKYLKTLHGFTNEVIRTRRLALDNNEEDFSNYDEDNVYGGKRKMAFLDMLLLSTIDDKPLSDQDIREEVDTFLFEGHDTVSGAIGFTIYELSKHPEVQEKIYQEQITLFGDGPISFTYSDLQDMKYLEMVIKEGLRLYPSVTHLGRTVVQDTYVRDLYIAKDSTIVVFVPGVQRNPKYFSDPHSFIPERFSRKETNKRNPFSTIYFSAGPRNCIGQKFAMMELKMMLAKIVRSFIIEPSGEDVVLLADLVLKPMNGIKVKLKKR